MDLQTVHNKIYLLANKEQHFWPHETLDDVLHSASLWKFNEYYEDYGHTQLLHDALSPFKVNYPFNTGNTPSGLITLPSTYEHLLALYVQYSDIAVRTKQVKEVNEDELGGRLDSQLKPVTMTAPIYTITARGNVQLYPQQPNTGYLFYLRTPIKPAFVYTTVGRVVTYNSAASTQFEWNDTTINQLVIKAVQLLGVNIEALPLVQYTEIKDQQKI